MKAVGVEPTVEVAMANKVNTLTISLNEKIDALNAAIVKAQGVSDYAEQAKVYCEEVFVAMQSLRAVADELETIVGEDYWPFPTYDELLFNV